MANSLVKKAPRIFLQAKYDLHFVSKGLSKTFGIYFFENIINKKTLILLQIQFFK